MRYYVLAVLALTLVLIRPSWIQNTSDKLAAEIRQSTSGFQSAVAAVINNFAGGW